MRTLERTHEIRLSVPAHPTSLGIVRRAIEGLRELCGEETAGRLALIFSELVTNAIRHAGIGENDKVQVALVMGDGTVRGSVTDHGLGFDPASVPQRDLMREGGFGLTIVDELASRWGVEVGDRTQVWFEL